MIDARKPSAAGIFYPAESELLARTVRDLLDAAPATAPQAAKEPALRAIVAPHDLRGPAGVVSAKAWARVAPHARRIRRVLLLGPAHHVPVAGIAAPFAEAFATPLGAVPVDRMAIEAARRFPQLVVTDLPHEHEPSLEVQLPFLQVLLADAAIVPLLVGELGDEEAAEVVDNLWDERTLAVVSTDLSHYFDAGTARRLDDATARAVESLEAPPIGAEQACGHAALRALLVVARQRGMRASCLDVRHSGEASGEVDEVVGFGAFAVG